MTIMTGMIISSSDYLDFDDDDDDGTDVDDDCTEIDYDESARSINRGMHFSQQHARFAK